MQVPNDGGASMPNTIPLEISIDDRYELDQICKSNLPDSIKRRAKMLLLKAEGKSLRTIAEEIGTSYTIVNTWVKRYENRDPDSSLIETLNIKKGRGRKRAIFDDSELDWIRELNDERRKKNESYASLERRIYREAESAGHPRLQNISHKQICRILSELK